MTVDCPLCSTTYSAQTFKSADNRLFYQCENCFLIFSDKSFLPSSEKEKQRYDLHQNSIDDVEYVTFLNQAIHPALNFINSSNIGLDYGCGKNAVLSKLLVKYHIDCDNYDVFYFSELADKTYDFIFCTETAEHFFTPKIDFEKIVSHLIKGGYFILMTEFWNNDIDFTSWYYARDYTHVSFYHQNTFNFIAHKFNLSIVFNDAKRVVIFIKN